MIAAAAAAAASNYGGSGGAGGSAMNVLAIFEQINFTPGPPDHAFSDQPL